MISLPHRSKKIFKSSTEFCILEQIGSGSFGKVFKAKHRESGRVFAIKRIELNRLRSNDKQHIEKEVEANIQINHSYKVKFYDYLLEEDDHRPS